MLPNPGPLVRQAQERANAPHHRDAPYWYGRASHDDTILAGGWKRVKIGTCSPIGAGVLRGDNADWEVTTYTSLAPLYRGRVYALVDDQSHIDLYPFVLVRPCQVCGALEVYHPASFSDDEVHLRSIDRGHSQMTSDARLLGAIQAAFARSRLAHGVRNSDFWWNQSH